ILLTFEGFNCQFTATVIEIRCKSFDAVSSENSDFCTLTESICTLSIKGVRKCVPSLRILSSIPVALLNTTPRSPAPTTTIGKLTITIRSAIKNATPIIENLIVLSIFFLSHPRSFLFPQTNNRCNTRNKNKKEKPIKNKKFNHLYLEIEYTIGYL